MTEQDCNVVIIYSNTPERPNVPLAIYEREGWEEKAKKDFKMLGYYQEFRLAKWEIGSKIPDRIKTLALPK